MNPKYQKNNRRNDRPRNEDFEFPLVGNFYSRSDMEMDANQIYGVLSDLNDQKVFSTISIYTQIKRSDLTKDPEKNQKLYDEGLRHGREAMEKFREFLSK